MGLVEETANQSLLLFEGRRSSLVRNARCPGELGSKPVFKPGATKAREPLETSWERGELFDGFHAPGKVLGG
jgi:hypothetical protein